MCCALKKSNEDNKSLIIECIGAIATSCSVPNDIKSKLYLSDENLARINKEC